MIEPQFERLPGIASATVSGGKTREITVSVNRDRLRARELGVLDVVSAVKSANLLLPSGTVRSGDREYNVFTNTQAFDAAKELEEVVLKQSGRALVRLADVAKVEDGTADQANIVRVKQVSAASTSACSSSPARTPSRSSTR